MNFTLLRVDTPKKLKSLSKSKINFFRKDEDISLFHYNQMENKLIHAVFNISDEFVVSTKKLGNQHNFVYSSLNNFFFEIPKHYAVIEYINKEYQDEVLTEIKNKTKASIEIQSIDNNLFSKIYKYFGGIIKNVSYTNSDEEFLESNNVNEKEFDRIQKDYKIESLTFHYENRYVRLTQEGKLSIDNSNQDYLIGFIKRVLDAVD